MAISKSLGNQLGRFELAINGAKAHGQELPKEAATVAANLGSRYKTIQELNAAQEKIKQNVAALTKKIANEVKAAHKEASKIVRLAEATFGPRDARMQEFRPASDARLRRQSKEENPAA